MSRNSFGPLRRRRFRVLRSSSGIDDLAQFLVEASIKFAHFSLRPATVAGSVEIATITKHEGFKWVVRKYYYSSEFNVRS